jgi:hypothetical protein
MVPERFASPCIVINSVKIAEVFLVRDTQQDPSCWTHELR